MEPKKILIIEDDLFSRELYERALEQAGFEIIGAGDGPEGLKLAIEKAPNLILLDIMLPKMNGIEVLRKLKTEEVTKNIPVIILTNLSQENVIGEAFKFGASGYLIKMRFAPQDIVTHIQNFLEKTD